MSAREHRPHDEGKTALEHGARAAFDASVDSLDAATLSRLHRARNRALEAATRSQRPVFGWRTWAPAGALAAGVLGAALLLRMPAGDVGRHGATASRAAATAQEPLELLAADEDFGLATAEEDLDFYAWIELAADEADTGFGQS